MLAKDKQDTAINELFALFREEAIKRKLTVSETSFEDDFCLEIHSALAFLSLFTPEAQGKVTIDDASHDLELELHYTAEDFDPILAPMVGNSAPKASLKDTPQIKATKIFKRGDQWFLEAARDELSPVLTAEMIGGLLFDQIFGINEKSA